MSQKSTITITDDEDEEGCGVSVKVEFDPAVSDKTSSSGVQLALDILKHITSLRDPISVHISGDKTNDDPEAKNSHSC